MQCALREVREEDLAVLFDQWADPVAARMAAFTASFAEARLGEIEEDVLRLE